jgi:hypothetical protein
MKIAICYSGQLRNMRMMLDNHINNLFIPLIIDDIVIDTYIYSDIYNTSRTASFVEHERRWLVSNINTELFDYFRDKLKLYSNNIKLNIIPICDYKENVYNQNMLGQLSKFYNVLKMVMDSCNTYDIIIRLRPDIYFVSNIDLHILDENKLYQNYETLNSRYNGDSIQIFYYKHLPIIIYNTEKEIDKLKESENSEPYECILKDIFYNSGLTLEWIDNLVYRWYRDMSIYFKDIQLKYFRDWLNIEYKYPFEIEKIIKLLEIRNSYNNILSYSDVIEHIDDDRNKILYISALDPDLYDSTVDIIYKDVVGLIPCSGSASRINGIPKFLLPCKEGNLINNTIDIFKKNNIKNIYIAVSEENKHHIKKINDTDNDIKYIVKNTDTMSETVTHLLQIKSDKYILIMPDTYFGLAEDFNELTKLNILLKKYDVVLVLWKIKEYQYGKLGQINIDTETKTIIDIVDKDINCRYEYSWGVIGWTNKMNQYIDPKTPHIGFLINKALELNIKIGYVISDTEYFDCGTPNEYFEMIRKYT